MNAERPQKSFKKYFLISENVKDMTDKLYPTSTEEQANFWSKHIRETLDVFSEAECGAHAALYRYYPIDYYVYLETTG